MNERGFGFVLGWFACAGLYFVAYSYQAFKKFIDKYDVLIYEKDLDGKQWSPSQEFGYDGDFYTCEHGRAFGISCSKCNEVNK